MPQENASTPLHLSYKDVAAALAGKSHAGELFTVPALPDHLVRGALDLRGLTLSHLSIEAAQNIAPEGSESQLSWLCAMDAVNSILNGPNLEHMPGAQNNIRAFHDHIINNRPTGAISFDWNIYVTTLAFFQDMFPERQSDLQPAHNLDPALLRRAQSECYLYYQRLIKNTDIIRTVIAEMYDPNSLAHMLASAIGDEPEPDEIFKLLLSIKQAFLESGHMDPDTINTAFNTLKLGELNIQALRDLFLRDAISEEAINRKEQEIKQLEAENAELEDKREKNEAHLKKRTKERIVKKTRARIHKIEKEIKTNQGKIGNIKYVVKDAKKRRASNIFAQSIKRAINGPENIKKVTEQKPDNIEGLYETYGQDLRRAQRIGRQIAQYILSPRDVHTARFQDEGVLDTSLLGSIIANPFGWAAETPYSQRYETYGQSLDTAITLLVDNSGSMGGEKIAMAFLAAECLGYWLSYAGINVEILSYTSNDFRIYKGFDDRYKAEQTKKVLAGLLTAPMGRTPTDEATIWAHDRLLQAPNKRRILMVLTDGAPEDKNKSDRVIKWIEANSPVELSGVGIMHDISDSYTSHIYVEKPSDLIASVAGQIRMMMDRPHESHSRTRRKPIIMAPYFGYVPPKEIRPKLEPTPV